MKRSLCIVSFLAFTLISLMYMSGGEKVFQSLRSSHCESITADGRKAVFSGKIYKKEQKGKSYLLYLKNVEIENKSVSNEKIIIFLSDESDFIPSIGQRVSGKGEVRFLLKARNPGNFNQKLYYQKQNIQLQIENAHINAVGGKTQIIKEKLFCLRQNLVEILYRLAGEKHGGILCAILLGDQKFVDPDQKEYYQKSGIGHLLAISGLHISFLGMGLLKLLRKLGLPIWVAAGVSSVILGFYAVMTGAGISVIRAYIMFVVRMGAMILGREYDGLTALAFSALYLMVKNPLNITQPAFLLSFGAVGAIYGIYPIIEESVAGKKKNGIGQTLWMMFSIHLVLTPIMLHQFYELNPYSFLWNLVAIPLSTIVMGFGMTGILSGAILEMSGMATGIPMILLKSASSVLGFYEKISRLIMYLPFAHIVIGRPSAGRIVLYYVLMSLFLYYMYIQDSHYKKVCIVVLAVIVLVIPGYRTKQVEITMLDIGQGDCFFMRTVEGTTHLIDGGSSTMKSPGKNAIEPFLKSKGISAVDYVWVSHGDMDHVNGIEEMMERQQIGVRIRNLVLIPEEFWDERLEKVSETAAKNKIPVYTTEKGKIWKEGRLKMTCLWPERKDHDYESNEGSMVLSLSYGEFDMLFTGDLERRGEAKVAGWIRENRRKYGLPERYEILKVGHHGSRFGTGEELLDCVRPSVALISSGRKNRYGHPHQEVIERLAKRKTRIYNTKDRHAVNLYTDGKKYCILIP